MSAPDASVDPPCRRGGSVRGQSSAEAVCIAATVLAVAGLAFGAVRAERGDDRAVRMAVAAESAPPAPVTVRGRAGSAVGTLPLPVGEPLAIARALVAREIAEEPRGSNWGPAIAVFTDGHREPWCADFVSYVLREGGRPLTGGASGGWRIAAAAGVRRWFVTAGRWSDRRVARPAPGDVVSFSWGHVGLVEAATGDDVLVTIEGNSGDALRRRVRPNWRADATIEGFGRP